MQVYYWTSNSNIFYNYRHGAIPTPPSFCSPLQSSTAHNHSWGAGEPSRIRGWLNNYCSWKESCSGIYIRWLVLVANQTCNCNRPRHSPEEIMWKLVTRLCWSSETLCNFSEVPDLLPPIRAWVGGWGGKTVCLSATVSLGKAGYSNDSPHNFLLKASSARL